VRYSLAIFHARKNGYLNDEALATELTARFYLEINALAEGKQYMKDAHYAYLKWGALAKTRALEQEFAYLSAQAGGRCSRVEAPRSCSD